MTVYLHEDFRRDNADQGAGVVAASPGPGYVRHIYAAPAAERKYAENALWLKPLTNGPEVRYGDASTTRVEPFAAGLCAMFDVRIGWPAMPVFYCGLVNAGGSYVSRFVFNGSQAGSEQYYQHASTGSATNLHLRTGLAPVNPLVLAGKRPEYALRVCLYVRRVTGSVRDVECWLQAPWIKNAEPYSRDWCLVSRHAVNAADDVSLGLDVDAAVSAALRINSLWYGVNEFDPATRSRWRMPVEPALAAGSGIIQANVAKVSDGYCSLHHDIFEGQTGVNAVGQIRVSRSSDLLNWSAPQTLWDSVQHETNWRSVTSGSLAASGNTLVAAATIFENAVNKYFVELRTSTDGGATWGGIESYDWGSEGPLIHRSGLRLSTGRWVIPLHTATPGGQHVIHTDMSTGWARVATGLNTAAELSLVETTGGMMGIGRTSLGYYRLQICDSKTDFGTGHWTDILCDGKSGRPYLPGGADTPLLTRWAGKLYFFALAPHCETGGTAPDGRAVNRRSIVHSYVSEDEGTTWQPDGVWRNMDGGGYVQSVSACADGRDLLVALTTRQGSAIWRRTEEGGSFGGADLYLVRET